MRERSHPPAVTLVLNHMSTPHLDRALRFAEPQVRIVWRLGEKERCHLHFAPRSRSALRRAPGARPPTRPRAARATTRAAARARAHVRAHCEREREGGRHATQINPPRRVEDRSLRWMRLMTARSNTTVVCVIADGNAWRCDRRRDAVPGRRELARARSTRCAYRRPMEGDRAGRCSWCGRRRLSR